MFWVCVCSLGYPSMQCACAILSSVACPALQYFSTLCHKRRDFRKSLPNTNCVFWFYVQLLFETFLIVRRTERDMITNVYRSSCKVPLCWSDFNGIEYSRQIFEKRPNVNFHENPFVGSGVVPCGRMDRRMDGRRDRGADMTKLIVAFRNFPPPPPKKNWRAAPT